MKLFKLILGLFLAFSLQGLAQETNIEAKVAVYLDSNKSLNQYSYAYDQLLGMLEKNYPESAANKEGWTYLKNNKRKSVAKMKAMLIPVYTAHFDEVEINKMTNFYKSDTGKQLINDRSKMTEEQKVILNTFFNTNLGKKIIEKQPILTSEIGTISENWSRDLYEVAVSLLKN